MPYRRILVGLSLAFITSLGCSETDPEPAECSAIGCDCQLDKQCASELSCVRGSCIATPDAGCESHADAGECSDDLPLKPEDDAGTKHPPDSSDALELSIGRVLPPVIDATVSVMRLEETEPLLEGRTSADGQLMLSGPAVEALEDETLYLVFVEGGSTPDGEATQQGLHAVAEGRRLKNEGIHLTFASEVEQIYLSLELKREDSGLWLTKDQPDPDAINLYLDEVAQALILGDLNNDDQIDHADVLSFDPARDADQLAFGLEVLELPVVVDGEETQLNLALASGNPALVIQVVITLFGDGAESVPTFEVLTLEEAEPDAEPGEEPEGTPSTTERILSRWVTGHLHNCAVLEDTSVKCWGLNSLGQLGDGTFATATEPVSVSGLSGVVELALGGGENCARLEDGTVQCWGGNFALNAEGQEWVEPVPVQIPDVAEAVEISAGLGGVCALEQDGVVKCWGSASGFSNDGAESLQPLSVKLMPELENAAQLAVGDDVVCGARGETVICVALEALSAVSEQTLPGVVKLEVQGGTRCALVQEGRVYCWGEAEYGLLGTGMTAGFQTAPTEVPGLEDVVDISLGQLQACAVFRTGEVSCWGGDYYEPTPTRVEGLADAVRVDSGFQTSCAELTSGEGVCWGSNNWSQLGLPHTGVYTETVSPVGLGAATQLAAGAYQTCAALEDGTVECFGGGSWGQLANGMTTGTSTIPVPAMGLTDVVELASGSGHSCAVTSEGALWCWGRNSLGQLGDGTTTDRTAPVLIEGLGPVKQVCAGWGDEHTCAVLQGGQVACWGNNQVGQLGDGTLESRTVPTLVDGLTDAVSVECGYWHNCALRADKSIACWGDNYYYVLGTGSRTDSSTPTAVRGIDDAVEVALGGFHNCVLRETGEVWCWGDNTYGQVGNGQTQGYVVQSPTPVSGISDAISVHLGRYYSCARHADGRVSCWGNNESAQLGLGALPANDAISDQPSPALAAQFEGAVDLACGQDHTCGLMPDGSVVCLGSNQNGLLGNGGVEESLSPQIVSL